MYSQILKAKGMHCMKKITKFLKQKKISLRKRFLWSLYKFNWLYFSSCLTITYTFFITLIAMKNINSSILFNYCIYITLGIVSIIFLIGTKKCSYQLKKDWEEVNCNELERIKMQKEREKQEREKNIWLSK